MVLNLRKQHKVVIDVQGHVGSQNSSGKELKLSHAQVPSADVLRRVMAVLDWPKSMNATLADLETWINREWRIMRVHDIASVLRKLT